MLDAASIVARLLTTDATVAGIAAELGVPEWRVQYVYARHATPRQRRAARARKIALAKLAANPARGGVPWNKGRKTGVVPPTAFRPGHKLNSKPIGTVIVASHQGRKPCRWIKVSDVGPFLQRWKTYARYAWEREHGQVPEGRRVYHLNLDQMDDRPENLAALTPAEAARRLHQLRPELAERATRRLLKYHDARRTKAEIVGARDAAWSCTGCGGESGDRPARCPKCGGGAFERVVRERRVA